jgi:hypothetical protein
MAAATAAAAPSELNSALLIGVAATCCISVPITIALIRSATCETVEINYRAAVAIRWS